MSRQNNTKKRSAATAGVKTLITTASVAATLVAWALLPANDPSPAGAATQQNGQIDPNVPGIFSQFPDDQQIDPSAPNFDNSPQLQAPRGFSGRQKGFTNSHSSR